ncbi:ubiquitin-conjugating enzyme/RWD-like protein [Kalaharituber pfeilii]|nr:ubiquitin-conjugating enzyme/RWD-like protein [Kalaharituber pfeilii]
MAERILMNEFKELQKEEWVNVQLKDDNIFKWEVALIVLNPTSLYYGGYFKASSTTSRKPSPSCGEMKFPKRYPYEPPEFKFYRPLWHPNIYKDGKLCISILHQPGEDEMSGELASERWSPAQRVESVLLSIISLLDDAEVSSPANVDAGVMLRKQPEEYKRIVKENVEQSKRDIPPGFTMPEKLETKPPPKEDPDNDFWCESDGESFWR